MLSTLFSMTQKVASKSKKRTALSFRKLFPDLFFIFSDILCDHRCRLFYNSTPLCKHIFCNLHIQFIILNHEDPDTRYGSRLKCDRLSRKIGKLSDIAVFLYNKDTSGIKIGSCPLILFFPSIHGKTAPDTVYCPLSQKFVSFRKIHFCKYRLDCLYAISTTHFPGQQYLFSRIRDDKFDFPEFSLHHFLKPLRFHSIRNRGIGIIKMCQQHCLWFKPL